MHNDIIEFGMKLTGHDRATVEQMYYDWKFTNKVNCDFVDEKGLCGKKTCPYIHDNNIICTKKN